MKKALLLFISLHFYFVATAQEGTDRTKLGEQYAKRELADALNNPSQKQILEEKVIKNKQTAISVAEAMLFSIYGKDNIVRQRPYESHLIDGYWVLIGTLPKDWVGGKFLIIINSTDGKIVKLTHGK
ncbi:NTF2 fold immunity protein [Pontibacter sp. CAU 1760]